MNKEQISFADIRLGDKLMLEGGYSTSEPVTALKLDRIPEDADGPYAGQWAWYFIESAPLVGQRCFVGEISVYRVLPEDEYEYAIQAFRDEYNSWVVSGKFFAYGFNDHWGTQEERQAYLEELIEDYPERTFRLVKRRKAGRIEDV